MSNVIKFTFSGAASVLPIKFKLNATDATCIANPKSKYTPKNVIEIPLDKIKIEDGIGNLKITLDVDRDGNEKVANWYSKFVADETVHMVHTAHGSNKPDKLNFALKGKLTIGTEEYPVCFGQGHYSTTNNWHLCSPAFMARADNKSGYLGNTFYVDADGTNEFKIIYADEITTGKGISIWAYTDSEKMTPRFDMEGDALHPFPYRSSGLANVGTMQRGKAYDTTGTLPTHRDFHVQVLGQDDREFENVLFKINRITGSIEGPEVLRNGLTPNQTVKYYSNKEGTPCVMNFGFSHAAEPLTNQSYIYTGPKCSDWMKRLSDEFPDVQIRDLVLAGSHDAGMYEVKEVTAPWYANLAALLLALTVPICGPEVAYIKAKYGIGIAMENLGATQKDNAYDQMMIGTRYFDFRPAYHKSTPSTAMVTSTHHIHGFIPGVLFQDFLRGIAKYLQEYPGEIAIVKISHDGINRDEYSPLTADEVRTFLDQMSPAIGYDLQNDLSSYQTQTLKAVAASGKRLIVLMDPWSINDSYNDESYSQSLTNPSSVIAALNDTIKEVSNRDYTVLQLQNTGSSALAHYKGAIAQYCTSWANDLLASRTGNLLQATKPIFDHATYQWLTESKTIKGINQQNGPVMIQNDFVDIALSGHAIALSRTKYANRKQQ